MESLDILVVDDDPQLRYIFWNFLTQADHQVILSESAEDALTQLPFQTFHIAYLDQNLPGMDGLILGEYLKKNNPYMKIAIVTAYPGDQLKKQAQRIGLEFIEKPFTKETLFQIIEDYQQERRETLETASPEDPYYHPNFQEFNQDLPKYFKLPKPNNRLKDALIEKIKHSLHNLSSPARYNERERIAVLQALLTANLLDINLPTQNGQTPHQIYDSLMKTYHKKKEFS